MGAGASLYLGPPPVGPSSIVQFSDRMDSGVKLQVYWIQYTEVHEHV